MKIRKIILIIFFYFLTFGNSFSIEADIFVQSTVNRASKILSENLSKKEKIDELKLIAEETVDINGIGLETEVSFSSWRNFLGQLFEPVTRLLSRKEEEPSLSME